MGWLDDGVGWDGRGGMGWVGGNGGWGCDGVGCSMWEGWTGGAQTQTWADMGSIPFNQLNDGFPLYVLPAQIYINDTGDGVIIEYVNRSGQVVYRSKLQVLSTFDLQSLMIGLLLYLV